MVKVVIALAYFCGGIPLAVHSSDWRFWKGRDSPLPSGDIQGIVASTSAAAVSEGVVVSHAIKDSNDLSLIHI